MSKAEAGGGGVMLHQSLKVIRHNGHQRDRPEVVGGGDGSFYWHWDERRGLEGSWNFGLALQGSKIPNGLHNISAPVLEACLDLELSKCWLFLYQTVHHAEENSLRGVD